MQKKIIALAVAAAFSAPAMAETTIYGVVDAAVANISTTGAKSYMTVLSGGLSTSRLGFKHAEGLDNGMTAIAVLEYKLDIATSDTLASARQEMLALAGDFGTVAAGYLQTAGYDHSVKYDPTAGSAVDSAAAVNPSTLISTGARAPSAAAYISPDMNGLKFAYNHAFDLGTIAGEKTTANLFSVNYAAGPLSVGGVYAGTANGSSGYAKTTDLGLGASYALDGATLFGSYNSTKTDGALGTDSSVAFHAVAPVAAMGGAMVFTLAKSTISSTAADDNKTGITVAYLKTLSKMVTGYGAIQKVSQTGSDKTVLAVGLRKKF
jgi:predicted porin